MTWDGGGDGADDQPRTTPLVWIVHRAAAPGRFFPQRL